MKKNTSVSELILFPNRILFFSLGITFWVSYILTFQNQSPFTLSQELESALKIIASDGFGYYAPLPTLFFGYRLDYRQLTPSYLDCPLEPSLEKSGRS